MKYLVYGKVTGSKYLGTFEADTEEAAIKAGLVGSLGGNGMTAVLTQKQTAELLHVSVRQIRRWVADRKLKASRLGHRTVVIQADEVERFLKMRLA